MLYFLGKTRPPCLSGWQMAVNVLLQLWDVLRDTHSFLLQDCLENYFSIIRAKGGQRNNQSVASFVKLLLR